MAQGKEQYGGGKAFECAQARFLKAQGQKQAEVAFFQVCRGEG
jgi:hypothetical protein